MDYFTDNIIVAYFVVKADSPRCHDKFQAELSACEQDHPDHSMLTQIGRFQTLFPENLRIEYVKYICSCPQTRTPTWIFLKNRGRGHGADNLRTSGMLFFFEIQTFKMFSE